MKAIIIHWTAGAHKANATDKKAYHRLVEGDGTVVHAVPIERNAAPLRDGYAAHTRNANTDRIGLSMCAMGGAVESPFNPGRWPITEVQFESTCREAAELCATYGIPVTPTTVLTHAEVQPNLGIAQRGKWDIIRLPHRPDLKGAKAVGDYMRDRVRHYLTEAVAPEPAPIGEPVPEGAQAVVSTNGGSLNLRAEPKESSVVRGQLPNGTKLEALSIEPEWVEVKTPFGAVGWVSRRWIKVIDGPAPLLPTKPKFNLIKAILAFFGVK